jgi:hypothetical protein
VNPNQHNREWWLARRGHLTGSRMARVLRGTWKGWSSLMDELQAELESDAPPADQWNGGPPPEAIRWGHHWETPAIENYCLDYGMDYQHEIVRPPFVESMKTPYIGASSDFLLIEGFEFTLNGEAKCPLLLERHSRVVMNRQVPEEHLPQLDCQMYVHDLPATVFLSYNPLCPDPLSRLARMVVERSPKREQFMLETCDRFYEIFRKGERPGPSDRPRTKGFPSLNF